MACAEPRPGSSGWWPLPARHAGVLVRPVQRDDGARFAELIRTLSPASRRQRFHAGWRELPPALVERFVDGTDGTALALLATLCADGVEVAIAEARHVPIDGVGGSRGTHEFAIVVHEAHRRAGLGEHLLRRLLQHAAAQGVQRLVGDVLRDNAAMLALAAKLGFTLRRHPDDARLLRVVHDLDVSAAPRHAA